jgi:hypothetical protein
MAQKSQFTDLYRVNIHTWTDFQATGPITTNVHAIVE